MAESTMDEKRERESLSYGNAKISMLNIYSRYFQTIIENPARYYRYLYLSFATKSLVAARNAVHISHSHRFLLLHLRYPSTDRKPRLPNSFSFPLSPFSLEEKSKNACVLHTLNSLGLLWY